MRLALRARDAQQVVLVELRLLEHRTGNRDVIAVRERAHDVRRRVRHRRNASREFGERLGLDLLDEIAHHIVEQLDVFVGELAGAVEK